MVVESDRALAHSHEVGGQRPVAAVVRQHVTVQRVVHDHYSFHAADSITAHGSKTTLPHASVACNFHTSALGASEEVRFDRRDVDPFESRSLAGDHTPADP